MAEKIVSVYAEQTPNPESLKFVFNIPLITNGKSYDFADPANTDASPLATALFKFNFVKGVFISQNFITLTKAEGALWAELIPLVRAFLKEYIAEGAPIVTQEASSAEAPIWNADDSPSIMKIKEILAKNVRPVVEMDGGNIDYVSFDEEAGLLTLVLKGSCSGCPSSSVTLKNGIQSLMQRLVPEVREVVALNE